MTKTYKICTLPGDGIGPEIMAEGVKVLKALGEKYDVDFACEDALIGGCAIDATGEALPQATLDAANASDAVLLAAVGGPKWDTTDPSKPRPEQGLLGIRKALGLYTNLRPVQIFNALAEASTLKPEVIDGVDMMIVRELTGGLYFGKRERFYDEEGAGTDGKPGQRAYDTLLECVLNGQKGCEVSARAGMDTIKALVELLRCDCPELIYLLGGVHYCRHGEKVLLVPNYAKGYKQSVTRLYTNLAKMERVAAPILSAAPVGASALDWVLAICASLPRGSMTSASLWATGILATSLWGRGAT